MKIFGVLLIKNELDVVESVINHALEWADKLFVVDNASQDGTWEKVCEMASDKVVPWGQILSPFKEGLRAFVWQDIGDIAKVGDWWCFLDADEFYFDDPREFLRAVPNRYGVVCTNTIEFVPTLSGLERFEALKEFNRENYRHYFSLDWSESRFFRSTDHLSFVKFEDRFPANCRAVYPKRIRVLHYPLRSAKQVTARLRTRRDAVERGFKGWGHAVQDNWSDKLVIDTTANLRSVDKDGFVWLDHARNFDPTGLNFRIRRWVKIAFYYLKWL